jgi:hypothetical protein
MSCLALGILDQRAKLSLRIGPESSCHCRFDILLDRITRARVMDDIGSCFELGFTPLSTCHEIRNELLTQDWPWAVPGVELTEAYDDRCGSPDVSAG